VKNKNVVYVLTAAERNTAVITLSLWWCWWWWWWR